MMPQAVLEKHINAYIRDLLTLDGWHVLMMEPMSRREWGKGTGEPGMPDMLAIRYLPKMPLFSGGFDRSLAQVLFVEGKRPGGRVARHQAAWHAAERERGALVIVVGEDFEASPESFKEWYAASGLQRREIR